MKLKVLYYGPITPKGAGSTGGFAAANRKNCDVLARMGINVVERPKRGKLQMLLQPLQLLLEKNTDDTLIHIATAMGGLLMIPVYLLLVVANLKRIPVLVDVRAGNFVSHFQQYGVMGKKVMRAILRRSALVAVEGSSYIPEFREIIKYTGNIYYFPNLAICDQDVYHNRNEKKTNIFYFGGITEDKGVSIMLDVIQLLGDEYQLFLAGPIRNDIDANRLKEQKNVSYLGMLNSQQLQEQMVHMHIFLFPTHHYGEGQSNSLIEAMSQGLIPIAADYGFCKEVVADCGQILPADATAEQYKEAIEIVANGDMALQGSKCVEHIKLFHNVDIEIKKLIQKYEEIIEANRKA